MEKCATLGLFSSWAAGRAVMSAVAESRSRKNRLTSNDVQTHEEATPWLQLLQRHMKVPTSTSASEGSVSLLHLRSDKLLCLMKFKLLGRSSCVNCPDGINANCLGINGVRELHSSVLTVTLSSSVSPVEEVLIHLLSALATWKLTTLAGGLFNLQLEVRSL